eukprot:gnl/TRDRNA2_/TRDRNA2_93069_c0_seq2.p1 gnl/TRDRNA2_/TRDRNA2_93069_c0~~gnl/TRDRNA2_/TRDRNA2_93069_c0_seq2.p1  ORF type:complete len:322 (+),score=53.26 gnl/TRDRNA2_/TRDRNA2_93069_c0_seq2:46-966(+)
MALVRGAAAAAAASLLAPLAGSESSVEDVDVAAFRQHGHVITRGIMDPSDVQGLASRLEGLLAEKGRPAFSGQGGTKELRFTFEVSELDAEIAKFARSGAGPLWSAAKALSGARHLCLLMDRGFSKDPGDHETHWHRDDVAVSLPAQHPQLRSVHAWIPLAPMDMPMGTLRYLVASHRRHRGWLRRFVESLWGEEFWLFATSKQAQDGALALGDVSWHDGWVVHAAGKNVAAEVRDGYAVSFAYCDSDEYGCGERNLGSIGLDASRPGLPSVLWAAFSSTGCSGSLRASSKAAATCRPAQVHQKPQ